MVSALYKIFPPLDVFYSINGLTFYYHFGEFIKIRRNLYHRFRYFHNPLIPFFGRKHWHIIFECEIDCSLFNSVQNQMEEPGSEITADLCPLPKTEHLLQLD